MGLIWEKLWKQTGVAGKAAQVAAAQQAARNLATVQWAGLLSWSSAMGRFKAGKPGHLRHTILACGQFLDEFRGQ